MRTLSSVPRLAIVGEALHGADWQRAMARDLGPFYPNGPRSHIDDRLVRRWLAGERPVAEWISAAQPKLLAVGVTHRLAEISKLRSVAQRLGYPNPAAVQH